VGRSISFDVSALDKSASVIKKIGDNVDDLGDKIDRAGGEIEVQVDDKEVIALNAKLERIDGKKITVDADIKKAEQRLSDLEVMLSKATKDRDKVRIEADIEQAKAKIESLKKEKIALDLDTKGANKAIDDVKAKIEKNKAKLDVDTAPAEKKVDELDNKVKKQKKDAEKPTKLDIDFNPGAVVSGIAAVTAALAGVVALAGLATGALAGIGAVGIVGMASMTTGFSGISDALTAMDADAGAAGASVKATATDIKAANASVKNAEQDLKDAQLDEKRAQEDLTDARKDAERQLRDLALSTEDMGLRQRDAALSVREAEERVNEVRKDGNSTSIDRERAELSLAEAKQRVKEIDIDAADLAEKKAEADSKGIAQSDQVVGAQERIAESHRRTEDATLRLEQAQQALQKTLNPPQSGGGGIDALAKAMEHLGPKAREFVTFFKAFTDGPLLKLKQSGQEAFLPGIQSGLEKLGPTMASLQGPFANFNTVLGQAVGNIIVGVGKMAGPFADFATAALNGLKPLQGAFEQFGGSLAKSMSSAASSGNIQALMGGISTAVGAALPVIGDLIDASLQAGKVLGPAFGEAFKGIADALKPLIAAMPQLAPAFAQLISAIVPLLPPITQIVAALGPQLITIFAQLATALLPVFQALANGATVLAQHPALLNAIVLGASALAMAMGPLSSVVGVVSTVIGGLSAPMLVAVGVIAALSAGVIYAWQNSESFRGKVVELWDALKGAFDQIKSAVSPEIQKISDVIRTQVVPALGSFVEAITPLITWLVEKLGPVIATTFSSALTSIRTTMTIIAGVINLITGIITGDWDKAWQGIHQIVSGALEKIKTFISNAKSAIGVVASGMWDGLKNAFKNSINSIIAIWNSLHFTIPAFDFAGVHTAAVNVGLNHITPFATGGIVTAPTLGLVGEAGPEAIIPLSRARDVLPSGGITINVQASAVLADQYAIAGAVTDALRTAVQRGMLPASVLA
jgi:phage-related protein/predicted  nucleic acid-binding Zn-ribbon protein